MQLNIIHNTDCLTGLRHLPDNCVDCCVTSPPYYGLRDYGVDGQIGLEETPEMYIERLVEVFMEIYRVLKKSGTLWINIGDSYAGSGRGKGDINKKGVQSTASYIGDVFDKPHRLSGYKNKDLIGVPWSLALALREKGWYLRQDIIWHKPNPMPESVTDRCTKAHEYILLLAKSPKYYFDYEAIQEPAAYDGRKAMTRGPSAKYGQTVINGFNQQTISVKGGDRWKTKKSAFGGEHWDGTNRKDIGNVWEYGFIRNKRSVWTVCTQAEKEAHFACFPEKLIVDCIKAGCPEGGIVLDPFMGSGTTAVVAKKLNRNYIGFELNPEYVEIANRKLRREIGMFL